MKKIILLCLLSLNLMCQNKEVKINFDVYLDNKKIETDSIQVSFNSKTLIYNYILINDKFSTFILPDKVYNITISHPNYSKIILNLQSEKLKEVNLKINLTKNEQDIAFKQVKFNKFIKTINYND